MLDSQDGFSVTIGGEMYDQEVSYDMLPPELTWISDQVASDPLFLRLQQLVAQTNLSMDLKKITYKVCHDDDTPWAEYDPRELLKKLTTMTPPRELDNPQDAFALRLGKFGNTFDKGKPLIGQRLLIKGDQFMAGARFSASFGETIEIGKLLRPGIAPFDGIIARLYCTEDSTVPLQAGIKIQNANHLHPQKDVKPVIFGWFMWKWSACRIRGNY